jgi:hypothetical protein
MSQDHALQQLLVLLHPCIPNRLSEQLANNKVASSKAGQQRMNADLGERSRLEIPRVLARSIAHDQRHVSI